MRKIKLLLILLPFFGFSQNKIGAEEKVTEGIKLHDEEKYDEALKKYDEALILDKNNLLALTEKSMTLEATKNYDEAIKICQFIIANFKNEDNKIVYLNYGNSLDHSKRPLEALKIYDEGLKKYPDFYQLHFNKGITLVNNKQIDKSLESFQRSLQLNPDHPGTLNALAVLNENNRAISMLCSLRYLSVDNKSQRAAGQLEFLQNQIKKGVDQKSDKSVSVSIDAKTLEKSEKNKKTPDDFSVVELILPLAVALDYDEKNKDKTDCQKLQDKIDTITSVLQESQKGKKGFYREFLTPYFIEMKEKKLVEAFAYIISYPTQSDDVLKYHQENSKEIERFYAWSENYQWK